MVVVTKDDGGVFILDFDRRDITIHDQYGNMLKYNGNINKCEKEN